MATRKFVSLKARKMEAPSSTRQCSNITIRVRDVYIVGSGCLALSYCWVPAQISHRVVCLDRVPTL